MLIHFDDRHLSNRSLRFKVQQTRKMHVLASVGIDSVTYSRGSLGKNKTFSTRRNK